MAEAALAAISATASIIQLVDFSSKIISRLIQYQSDVGEVPKAFRSISSELPVLSYTLSQMEEAFRSGINYIDPQIVATLVPIISECQKTVQELCQDFEKLLPSPEDSWGKRQAKAIKSVFRDSNIERNITKTRNIIQSLVNASLPLKVFESRFASDAMLSILTPL